MNNILNIHSIESFGIHDGPGIRMVIFLQGCNLQCSYCHNADTISNIGGRNITIDEIILKSNKLKPYFNNIGGITISGGEPLLQSETLINLCDRLHDISININIDTNGTIVNKYSNILLSDKADLVMFDIKGCSDDKFKNITTKQLHNNVINNISLREQCKKPYWLRYVLIPTITDSDEDLQYLIDTFGNNKYLQKIEILPYHKLGIHKWESIGIEYKLKDINENTKENLIRVEDYLSKNFRNIEIK